MQYFVAFNSKMYLKSRYLQLFLLQVLFLIGFKYASGTEVRTKANILLYIGGISSHSHQYSVEPLMNKLADRGHNVTILSPLRRTFNHPKIHYFCPSELLAFHKQFLIDFGIGGLKARTEKKYSVELLKTPKSYFDPCFDHNEVTLKSPEFKAWAESASFDLIIVDSTCNEGAYALVDKYRAKSILYTPIGTVYNYHFDLFGVPPESSWFPSWNYNYEGKMKLIDRIYNTFTTLHWYLSYKWEYLIRMETMIREQMQMPGTKPLDKTSLEETVRRTDLILSCQHYSDQFAKSLPPFVVPVGGLHLQESTKKLDPELENFIREGTEGFMYISFGSIITISTIQPQLLRVFFDAFESFKNMRFLWKWEGHLPENVPKNILFKPWFEQNDVIAHPKIRGIIFQGGQVTNQQAIFHAVPLIVFPVNGDQDLNAKRIRCTKNGIDMELHQLTTPDLTNAINTLLNDKSYAAKARHLSEMTRDRPMLPLDLAVWWTEYILRHDDNSQLKPDGFHLQWWKQRSVDVWGCVFLILLTLIVLCISVIRVFLHIYHLFSRSAKQSHGNKFKNS